MRDRRRVVGSRTRCAGYRQRRPFGCVQAHDSDYVSVYDYVHVHVHVHVQVHVYVQVHVHAQWPPRYLVTTASVLAPEPRARSIRRTTSPYGASSSARKNTTFWRS